MGFLIAQRPPVGCGCIVTMTPDAVGTGQNRKGQVEKLLAGKEVGTHKRGTVCSSRAVIWRSCLRGGGPSQEDIESHLSGGKDPTTRETAEVMNQG